MLLLHQASEDRYTGNLFGFRASERHGKFHDSLGGRVPKSKWGAVRLRGRVRLGGGSLPFLRWHQPLVLPEALPPPLSSWTVGTSRASRAVACGASVLSEACLPVPCWLSLAESAWESPFISLSSISWPVIRRPAMSYPSQRVTVGLKQPMIAAQMVLMVNAIFPYSKGV